MREAKCVNGDDVEAAWNARYHLLLYLNSCNVVYYDHGMHTGVSL